VRGSVDGVVGCRLPVIGNPATERLAITHRGINKMEASPHKPGRLSGKLWYGPPHPWQFISTVGSVEIVPASTPRGLIAYFFVLGVLALTALPLALRWFPNFDVGRWWWAFVALACTFFFAGTFVQMKFATERRRGTIMRISVLSKEVQLFIADQTWPFDRIVRWEIISGAKVLGEYGKLHSFADVISELQVVVDNFNGDQCAWPIIGSLGRNDQTLNTIAEAFAQMTAAPLVMTSVSDPITN
jgi:hypothetical protein